MDATTHMVRRIKIACHRRFPAAILAYLHARYIIRVRTLRNIISPSFHAAGRDHSSAAKAAEERIRELGR